jgi:hypothetical protein
MLAFAQASHKGGFMEIPILTQMGTCRQCKKMLVLKPGRISKSIGALPYHRHKGKRCENSGYSASYIHPIIQTDTEMEAIATFISKDDDRRCFKLQRHSVACDDGQDCNKIRTNLARALANYYLKKIKTQQVA